jgi:hypothetical protein
MWGAAPCLQDATVTLFLKYDPASRAQTFGEGLLAYADAVAATPAHVSARTQCPHVDGVTSVVFPVTPGAYVLGVGGATDEPASLMQVPDDSACVLGHKFAHFGVIEERVHRTTGAHVPSFGAVVHVYTSSLPSVADGDGDGKATRFARAQVSTEPAAVWTSAAEAQAHLVRIAADLSRPRPPFEPQLTVTVTGA